MPRGRPRSTSPGPSSPRALPSAYVAGLRLLAGRELSARQVQDRLIRRGYDEAAVDAALSRLKAERAIDDRRAAEAWARAALSGRKKGRLRIARELAKAGIDDAVAREVLASLFETVDEDQLIADALARRLRGRPIGTDQKVRQRLYRYLIAQGFSSRAVLAVLKASKGSFGTIDDHDVE